MEHHGRAGDLEHADTARGDEHERVETPQQQAQPAATERARASLLQVLNARGTAPPVEVPLAYLSECTSNFDWAERGLGEGAFGRVVEAQDKETQAHLAVKQIKTNFKSWDDCVNLRELKALKALRHKRIVRCVE